MSKLSEAIKKKYPKTAKIAEELAMPVAHKVIKTPIGQFASTLAGGGNPLKKVRPDYDAANVKKDVEKGLPIQQAINKDKAKTALKGIAAASLMVHGLGANQIKNKLVDDISRSQSVSGIASRIKILKPGISGEIAKRVSKKLTKKMIDATKRHVGIDRKKVENFIDVVSRGIK